jgi:hypothetical protein
MTPAEYRAAIAALGMSQARAARFFEAGPASGPRWARNGPPAAVAMMLRLMMELHMMPGQVDLRLGRPRVHSRQPSASPDQAGG